MHDEVMTSNIAGPDLDWFPECNECWMNNPEMQWRIWVHPKEHSSSRHSQESNNNDIWDKTGAQMKVNSPPCCRSSAVSQEAAPSVVSDGNEMQCSLFQVTITHPLWDLLFHYLQLWFFTLLALTEAPPPSYNSIWVPMSTLNYSSPTSLASSMEVPGYFHSMPSHISHWPNKLYYSTLQTTFSENNSNSAMIANSLIFRSAVNLFGTSIC